MAAFSLRLDLAKEVNRHFPENDYGDLLFFSEVLSLAVNFSMLKKDMGQFSVLSKTQSSET